MDLSDDDSGDETNNGEGVTVDENELLNSDDEEGGRHVLHNTIDEEELLYEGDEDEILEFEAEDDVLDIALEDEELDTPDQSSRLSPSKVRTSTNVVADDGHDDEGHPVEHEGGDESFLDTTDEGQNVGSPDQASYSHSKPTVDSDEDDDSPRTRGRFLTERKTEDINKMGGSTSMGGGSEGKPITTLGERNPRIAHYPDSRRGGRGGGGFNRQNMGPRPFGPPRGMMGNQNLRHRQPSLLGDRPRPLLRYNPNYNQQIQALHSEAPVRQLQGGFIDFNQPLRPHGKPVPNTQSSPPKASQGGFPPGGSPPGTGTGPGPDQQQQQNFNNKVPGSPQQQQQQQQQKLNNITVNKSVNVVNRSPNVVPQKRPLAPRVPQNPHMRPRIPGQNPFLSSPANPNLNQPQRPILPMRPGGGPQQQHRHRPPPPNLQQNRNRPQFPGQQQQHWRPNSPHNSPQQMGQRGMPLPGIPGVGGPLPDQQEQPFNNNFQPLLMGPHGHPPQPPHGQNFDNIVPPPGTFQNNRQQFLPPQSMHQFSSPEEQHLMYNRNMPPQQQLQPILPIQHQPQPPNNQNLYMQQPQQFPPPPHQEQQQHSIPPQHHPNTPFYIVRPNVPNVVGDMNRGVPSSFSQQGVGPNQGPAGGRGEEYRQFPGQMPHHHLHQEQGGWPLPPHHQQQHHQGEMPPQFHQQQQQPPQQQQQQPAKMHPVSFQQSPQEPTYQHQSNPFLRRDVSDMPRNEPRYGRDGSGMDPYDESSYQHSGSDSRRREYSQERYDYGDSYRDHDPKARSSRGSPHRNDDYRAGHDRLPMKRTSDFRDDQSHYSGNGGGSPEKRLHGRLGPPVPKYKQRDDSDPRKDEVIKIIKESQKVMGLDADYLEKMEEQKRLRDRILREKEERRKHQQHSGGGGGDDDEIQNVREVNVEPSRREVRILHGGGGGETSEKIVRKKVWPSRNPPSSQVDNVSHEDQSATNKSNKSIYVNPKAFNGDLSVLNTNLKMINMNVRSMGGPGAGGRGGGAAGGSRTKVVTSTRPSVATSVARSQNIAGMGPTTKKKTILRIVRNKKGEIISKSKVIVLPKQSRADGSSTVSTSA